MQCARLQLTDIGRVDVIGMAPERAMLEFEPGQKPNLGCVLERINPIGDPEIEQGLGADDRARAAGAIDHDLGLGGRARCS